MSVSSSNSTRLRSTALGFVVLGIALAYIMGSAFPPAATMFGTTNVKAFLSTPSDPIGGDFNWLFAILTFGPFLIAAAILYGSSEIVAAQRRYGRSRSSESGGSSDLVI